MSEFQTASQAKQAQNTEGIPLTELSIFPATKAQIYESRKRTFTMWGRGVTLEEYLKRDARYGGHEVSADGRLVTWVLARRDDPKGIDFLCSCETYKREGFVVNANATTGNSVVAYSVAALFTSPRNRKKGYATHLMRMLHWILAPPDDLPQFPTEVWGNQPDRGKWIDSEQIIKGHGGDAVFSTLYSDVGPEIYRGCGFLPGAEGWVVTDFLSSGWDVDSVGVFGVDDEDGWEWLDIKGVYDYWKVDADLMKREMEESNPTNAICTLLPDKGVAEFQIIRLSYFWNPLGITDWGLRRGKTFASWTIDVRPDSSYVMLITRLRAEVDEFENLVKMLVKFGRRHKISHFEVWGLKEEFREQFGFVKTWNKDIHLPSIKCYNSDDLKWLFNERFCYC
ncbi:hypothetical protein JR316_0012837 [Psilocybe cubensis]|uniref:LYC1 C-terminal domain-containing protein n=2 Tax=Psilocybe cubensis TaxID=181762 RepID=A0A8H7XQB9_PSICU|nr:hypothetical protein JR316_0012837 [Psilocybe cubensis]KAH9474379.1 hypothetical protein JR316_0012837 [Psilocybe cubensis]